MLRIAIVFSAIFALVPPAASAAEVIGTATEATNEVTGTLDELVRIIKSGDDVSANETVKTGAGSATLITFLDDTSLNIGASSTIVLDSFVFNPDGSADDAVINLTKGAFRFVTGKSDPSRFVVRTEVATLGIRGTDFVVLCDDVRCGVVVANGIVKICPRPRVPRDEIFRCPGEFDLNSVENAAIVGPNGQNTGPKSISRDLLGGIFGAVASGRDGLTTAIIAVGLGQRRNAPPASTPINATPG